MRVIHRVLVVLGFTACAALANERPSLVTVSVSEDHAIEGGGWRWTVKRTAEPWVCGTAKQFEHCTEHSVVVDNFSPRTLECYADFQYTPVTGDAQTDRAVPALVLPNSAHEIRGRVTLADTRAELLRLDCHDRAPYVRIKKTPGCKYEMFGKAFETYYPDAAVRQTLEGPVVVSFLLPGKNGAAKEVKVVESSMIALLDAAALRFISDQRFTTGCPGTRFDLRMRFALRDRYPGVTQ